MTAPIIVTVYNRVEHFKQCIESLKKFDLASETELYISSDGPFQQKDVEAIQKIREYCSEISGFKNIVSLFQKENMGQIRCTQEAYTKIFKAYDRLIFLEDDIVVSPDFLTFLNDALEKYKDNQRVYSVSSFSLSLFYPQLIKDETAVYFTHRFNPWGFGIWHDRYANKPRYSIDDLKKSLTDSTFIENLNGIGSDLYPVFLSAIDQNKMLVQDYLNVYHMVRNNLVTVTPYRSKAFNIGNDGSGIRTSKNKRYTSVDITFLNEKYNYFLRDEVSGYIDNSFNRIGHNHKWNKLKVILFRLGLLAVTYRIHKHFKNKSHKR